MLLEFLKLNLPWNNLPINENVCEEIALIKEKSLEDPQKYLWTNENTKQPEVQNIFYSLQKLKNIYDRPDYQFIRQQLTEMLDKAKFEELKAPENVASRISRKV